MIIVFIDNFVYFMLNHQLAAFFTGRVSNIESAVVMVEMGVVMEGRENCIHFSMAHCGLRLMIIIIFIKVSTKL